MVAASLDLQSLEQYCETLYNPSSQASRLQVETLLNYHFPTFSLSSLAVAGTTATSTSTSGSSSPVEKVGGHSPSINTPIESALFCRSLLESLQHLDSRHWLKITSAPSQPLSSVGFRGNWDAMSVYLGIIEVL
ncbi:hypothetical protein BGZ83_002126 [Gryganskiella cystojenkinii]|nr:hypothetical protein BGZ83_002126 [Gryganskiella cystojenkinii]